MLTLETKLPSQYLVDKVHAKGLRFSIDAVEAVQVLYSAASTADYHYMRYSPERLQEAVLDAQSHMLPMTLQMQKHLAQQTGQKCDDLSFEDDVFS